MLGVGAARADSASPPGRRVERAVMSRTMDEQIAERSDVIVIGVRCAGQPSAMLLACTG